MSERRPARLSNQILDQATAWFVDLNEGTQDEQTRVAFHEWLRTSPEHVRAFLQIAAHWEDDAPPPREAGESGAVESVDELIEMARLDKNIVPLMLRPEEPRAGSARGEPAAIPEGAARNRAVRGWRRHVLAASLLIAAVGLSVPYYLQRNVYSTAIGEQRSLRLEDGSTVEINARSRIKVRYSEHERHVELLEGQALFEVAKDKGRPFIVQSGRTRIQAVGTRFDVYRKNGGTIVTVVEGRVSILAEGPRSESDPLFVADASRRAGSSAIRDSRINPRPGTAAPRAAELLLAAGEQVTVSVAAPAQPRTANIAAATAWTQRRLIFTRAPLSEVVEEFNRYNSTPLIIADPSIADTEISGSFSSSDPSTLLRFLHEVGSYAIEDTGSGTRISRK